MVTAIQQELDAMLAEHRQSMTIKARFLRPLAGGQPASDDGLRAFIKHHLGIAPDAPEFEAAFQRIRKEEIGERSTTPETGEVQTEEVYAVNVIRKSEHGSFLLEHQLKALIKQAASRLGLFQVKGKVGAKGDIAELGTITATGESLQNQDRPWEIYLRKNGAAAATHFVPISGSVGTPQGKKSIQHHTEVAEEGAEFSFQIAWPKKRLTMDDMKLILAAATQIGVGSCLSLGYGRFEVVDLQD